MKSALISPILATICCLPALSDTVETFITPFDGGQVETRVIALIHGAKSKIRMTAYALTDLEITSELISASKRGVDVQILADQSQSKGKYETPALNALIQADISVTIGTSPVHGQLLHAKFISVDS